MADAARWLDGNALAGVLAEAFGEEMTAVERACDGCGAERPLGAYRAYLGAGIVLRCPACGATGLRIVALEDRISLSWSGGPGPAP
jgi:hypothetical protein